MIELEPIITHVAHTGSDELQFHGQRVLADLLGRTTTAQMLLLGMSGNLPTQAQVEVLDDILTTMSSADPRMWPFKITRLASAFGTPSYGVAATLVAAEGGMFGPNRILGGARWLIEVAKNPSISDEDLLALIAQGSEGFGVTYRDRDERLEAMLRQAERRGRHELQYTKLLRRAMSLARSERKLEAHAFLGIAALALDAALPLKTIGALATLALFHDAIANALEGATQRPAALRALPIDAIEYRGCGARQSIRAMANAVPSRSDG